MKLLYCEFFVCLNNKSIASSSKYFVSPSIIPSDFNNETKKNRAMFHRSFWVTLSLPKIFHFSFAQMYNITGNTICKNLQDSSAKINVVNPPPPPPPPPPAFVSLCDSS